MYNQPQRGPETHPGAHAVGRGFGTWFHLKLFLIGLDSYQRASDRGASAKEAFRAGVSTAFLWAYLVISVIAFPILNFGSVAAKVFAWYHPALQTFGPEWAHRSGTYVAVVTLVAGLGGLILQALILTILYSRMRDQRGTTKRGLLYRIGFRIRRTRLIYGIPTGVLVLIELGALGPFYIIT